MSWSADQLLKLIDEYSRRSFLYDTMSPQYRMRHLRKKAIDEIVESLKELRPKTTEAEVSRKINGIRNTYMAERRKYLESIENGAGTDEIYKPTIWYYEKLTFLNQFLQIKKGSSSEKSKSINSKETVTKLSEPLTIKIPESSVSIASSEDIQSCSPDILSPSISDYSVIQPERPECKKIKQNSITEFENNATRVMKKIMDVTKTEDECYGEYIGKSLMSLKNLRNKIEARHQIDQILYEARLKDFE